MGTREEYRYNWNCNFQTGSVSILIAVWVLCRFSMKWSNKSSKVLSALGILEEEAILKIFKINVSTFE